MALVAGLRTADGSSLPFIVFVGLLFVTCGIPCLMFYFFLCYAPATFIPLPSGKASSGVVDLRGCHHSSVHSGRRAFFELANKSACVDAAKT